MLEGRRHRKAEYATSLVHELPRVERIEVIDE